MLLERHQEVHDCPYLWVSVGEVTGLDEHGRSTDPAVLGVDKPRLSQNGHKGVEVAVDVADRDDSVRAFGRRLPGGRCRGGTEQQRAQDRDKLQTLSFLDEKYRKMLR